MDGPLKIVEHTRCLRRSIDQTFPGGLAIDCVILRGGISATVLTYYLVSTAGHPWSTLAQSIIACVFVLRFVPYLAT